MLYSHAVSDSGVASDPGVSASDEVFCCMGCRLLQSPATECVECGSPLMATIANQRALLERDLSDAAKAPSPRKQALREGASTLGILAAYAGFIAGSTLWWPVAPIVIAGGVGAGLVSALRRRPAIAAIDSLPVMTGQDAVTRKGIAHRLSESVASITGHGNELAEQVVIRNKKGLLFRRVRGAPFVVELEGGGRLVVLGTLRVESPSVFVDVIKKGDPRALALGLEDLPIKGELHVNAVREGDAITVTGVETEEIVPELAFHRDAGETAVMRGRAKAVVAIRAANA
jgi:hypothetical protein